VLANNSKGVRVHRILILIVGSASAGLIAVGVVMNFAFGSSFGSSGIESYAYGAAFACADLLKAACPIVIANSVRNHRFGASLVGGILWVTLTACSFTSAIGFASANRTFMVDTRTVQVALNASRLASLDADHRELRRIRDQLAAQGLLARERSQLASAAQRLETAISTTRGQLELSAPIVSTPNPQAHTLSKITALQLDTVEVGLVLLVAVLVEMGCLGPFITMNLPRSPSARVPVAPEPTPPQEKAAPHELQHFALRSRSSIRGAIRPWLMHSGGNLTDFRR
jgi:hypothetical protein